MTKTWTMEVTGRTGSVCALMDSLRAFSEARSGTLRMVSGLTAEQAGYATAPDTWPVVRILDHLLKTEALYRTQMKRLLTMAREGKRTNFNIGLEEFDLNLPFIPRALMPVMALPLSMMNMFVPPMVRETLLRFPIMKAKNPKVAEPAFARPLGELREHLRLSLAETEALFAGPLPAGAGRVTVSHPVFGRNTIANILGLMTAHEERHWTQISGIMRHSGFPAGVML